MNTPSKGQIGWAVVVVATLLATLFFGVKYPLPEPPEATVEVAGVNVRTEKALQVQNYIENRGTLTQAGAATMASTLAVTGNTSVGGTLGVFGNIGGGAGLDITAGQVDIGDWVNLSARTPVVVSAGSIITPTGTFQGLTSTGVVTTSTSKAVADGAEIGDLLILRNANAADAITIDGVGANVECKVDKALGPGDILMLIWAGNDWNCISLSDNS